MAALFQLSLADLRYFIIMKNEEPQNNQMQEITESWIKPEIAVASVTEETQGLGGSGPDFGSELS